MKIQHLLLYLLCLLIVSTANAQDPLVFIEPLNPNSGDTIRVGISVDRCDTMPYENSQGLTHLLNINGTNVELNTIALTPILPGGAVCLPPNPIAYYDLGTFDEGDYSLTVWVYSRFTTFPFPSNFDPPPPYGFINFSVSTAPVSVPLNTFFGLLLTLTLLIGSGLYRIKKT